MASHHNKTSPLGHTNHCIASPDDDGPDDAAEKKPGVSSTSCGASAAGAEKCCCGKSDCSFLMEHLGVERDLDMAARLGQVCSFFFFFFSFHSFFIYIRAALSVVLCCVVLLLAALSGWYIETFSVAFLHTFSHTLPYTSLLLLLFVYSWIFVLLYISTLPTLDRYMSSPILSNCVPVRPS